MQDEIANFERELGGKANSGARVSDFAGHSKSTTSTVAGVHVTTETSASMGDGLDAVAEVDVDTNADAHAHVQAQTDARDADSARATISTAHPENSALAHQMALLLMPDGTHKEVELVKEEGGDDESGFVCVRFANGTTEFVDSDDISF